MKRPLADKRPMGPFAQSNQIRLDHEGLKFEEITVNRARRLSGIVDVDFDKITAKSEDEIGSVVFSRFTSSDEEWNQNIEINVDNKEEAIITAVQVTKWNLMKNNINTSNIDQLNVSARSGGAFIAKLLGQGDITVDVKENSP